MNLLCIWVINSKQFVTILLDNFIYFFSVLIDIFVILLVLILTYQLNSYLFHRILSSLPVYEWHLEIEHQNEFTKGEGVTR